jgi:hypothetical protein
MAEQPVYPEILIYVQDTIIGNLEITPYLIGDIDVEYGIDGNSVLDRVASTGSARFTLNDRDGLFKPEDVNFDTRFKKGARVFIYTRFMYNESYIYKSFIGRIADLDYETYTDAYKNVKVTVLDWINVAANMPMISPAIQVNKRADEAINTILIASPQPPTNKTLMIGSDTFTTVFDSVRSETKALAEISKLVMSELGYFYVRHGDLNGERVVFEGRSHRNLHDLDTAHVSEGFLLKNDGFYLTQADGFKLLLHNAISIPLEQVTDSDVSFGKKIANRIKVKAYPRLIDTSNQILASLDSPVQLSAGTTRTGLKLTYKNPSQTAERTNGKDMVAPVATTDYLMFANSDGTGTNLTANLVVTATYGSADVIYSLQNTSGTAGYVTKLQARGKGIYFFNPTEFITEDSTSELAYGYEELSIEQKYQNNPYVSSDIATSLLNQYKEPITDVNGISGLANITPHEMIAFLSYDVGEMIHVEDSINSINGEFFIQNVKYTISQGGIIHYHWGLISSSTLASLYWALGTFGNSELNSTTVLGI